jgi:hypothetical protein
VPYGDVAKSEQKRHFSALKDYACWIFKLNISAGACFSSFK